MIRKNKTIIIYKESHDKLIKISKLINQPMIKIMENVINNMYKKHVIEMSLYDRNEVSISISKDDERMLKAMALSFGVSMKKLVSKMIRYYDERIERMRGA